VRQFVSFTSVGIRIIAIVADKRFVGIGDMKADAMEEFDNREDFEVTFFSWMHRGSIDNGGRIFDVVDFMRRERRVNNIVGEIKEGLIVVFLDGGIEMDREAGMAP